MSLFGRKKVEHEQAALRFPFKIYQFFKIEGLKQKQKQKYKPTEFVSPIFGLTVKDVTAVPYASKDTGDKAKQFDFIRENPLEDQSTYQEFKTTLLTSDSRKEIFGSDAVVDKTRKYVDPRKGRKGIQIPYTGKDIKMSFAEIPLEEQEIDLKPVLEEKIISKAPFADEKTIKPQKPVKSEEKIIDVDFIEPDVEEVKTYQPDISEQTETSYFNERQTPKEKVRKQSKGIYRFPSVEMFSKVDRDQNSRPDWLVQQEQAVNETLAQFTVPGKVQNIIKGPTVTRHEIELEPGVNVKSVSNLKDNLMMNLAATSIRIEAPIPGKPYVGIELPNEVKEIVAFGNVVSDKKFIENKDKPLMIALGVDIDGNNIFANIKNMPHGLVAGATNSGKSVCVNTIIMSLLMKNHPDDLKFIMIDPKMVELSIYNDIPHLATPVITDAKMAAVALSWTVDEMERRFIKFLDVRVKDLDSYNQKALVDPDIDKLPYIIVIIDELADLMSVSASEVEDSIQRLAQKARAAGIHLIVATQRPTTDVVKGTIKANILTRIAFKVSSYVDSITILDSAGAEQLLGRGDMLFKTTDRPIRLQGAFIKDSEIEAVTDFIKAQMEPDYLIELEELKTFSIKKETMEADELLIPVTKFVVTEQSASINIIQKQFNIGFNRAQRLMEMLEQQGVVSASEGTKARQVLITLEQLENEE